jgi:hypothetical protein
VKEEGDITTITLENEEKFVLTNTQLDALGGMAEVGDYYVVDGNDEYVEAEAIFESIYKKV